MTGATRTKRPLRPEPPADVEANECGAVHADGYVCHALSGHGGNHTCYHSNGQVWKIWRRS